MKPTVLGVVIILVALVGGVIAYQAYQHDENTLDISVGSGGIKVD
jgi:hypothetical protein